MKPLTAPVALSSSERRLQRRVAKLVGSGLLAQRVVFGGEVIQQDDSQVVAAFTGYRRAPGAVDAIVPVLPPIGPWFALIASLFGGSIKNKKFTIALVGKNIYLFDSRCGRPTKVLKVFEGFNLIGLINDSSGDSFLTLAGVQYWINGFWSTQLFIVKKHIDKARKLKNDST